MTTYVIKPYLAPEPEPNDTRRFADVAPGIQEVCYMAGDLGGIPRFIDSSVAEIANVSVVDPAALQALGLANATSMLTGAMATARGRKMLETAKKIDDVSGAYLGHIVTARGIMETAGGGVFTAYRILDIHGTYLMTETAHAALNVLFKAGLNIFSLVYTLLGLPFAYRLYKSLMMRKEVMESEDVVKTLEDRLHLSEKNWAQIDQTVEENTRYAFPIVEVRQKEIDAIPNDVWLEIKKRVDAWADPLQTEGQNNYFRNILTCHYVKEVVKHYQKNIVKLTRRVGSDVYNELCKETHDPVAIKKHFKNYIVKNIIVTAACINSLAMFIIALNVTGWGLPAAFLISTTGMLAVDGYFLKGALNEKDPKSRQKVAALALTLFLTGIGAYAMFLGRNHLLTLILTAGVTATWVGLGAYSIYKWNQAKTKVHEIGDNFFTGISIDGVHAASEGGADSLDFGT